ncbi:hypothetical protein B0H13DRAFT_1601582 [Mycena leptocephala]|nr:hypothetical protein B0H13DRAFT_1601582 [Mycena leptocephala]
MSDFFSQVGDGLQAANNSSPDDTKTFADAIAARFGQGDNVLTARLLPPVLRMPNTPMANLSIHPLPSTADSTYIAVPPHALSQWLDDPRTLVVDIRPHAAYSSARLARAVSLSVPSTLLKRPLFSLQRLSAMLPSHSARTRFSAWRAAPQILVYDADSTALSDTSNIQGLLRKFRAEAPEAPTALAWVQGGFQAVWALRRDLVDAVPPTPETETETDDDDDHPDPARGVLRAHHLPRAAFALASTTQGPRSAGKSASRPFRSTHGIPAGPHLLNPAAVAHPTIPAAAFNPFFDAVRQNAELSHGITERIPLRLPRRVRRRVSELPFQWLRDIARRAGPVTPPDALPSTSAPTPPFTPPSPQRVEEGTEALAMQFYRIELAEQRRMMGVMEHHSRESGGGKGSGGGGHKHGFPFSITAGVEKGSKNRYRNIWPFEHARVRLHRLHAGHDDYVNASHVQPLGTRRRYIATQGPLEATFGDFWTLVWQQNIHVIVMLTREVEGAMVKCGSYWRPGTYGPLRVELLGCAADGNRSPHHAYQHNPLSPHLHPTHGAHTTPPPPPPQLIKRTLRLTHAAHPGAPPRCVVQLQYLGWPDMNVPEDARGVLGIVWEVGRVVEEVGREAEARAANARTGSESEVDGATGVLRRALRMGDAAAPVLLHCSAGVGRTGGFIAVDAVLDAVRQEAREMYAAGGPASAGSAGSAGSMRGGSEGIVGISAGMRASGISGGAPPGRAEEEDRMEVDVEVEDADADTDMHEGRGMRTPMQVDSAEIEMDMGETRRWAQRVADTKVQSLPSTAFPTSTSTALGLPFQFQPPASMHRTTFSLNLPTAHHSLPTAPSPNSHSQSPENKSASLPINPMTVAAAAALPLSSTGSSPWLLPPERKVANSPVPSQVLSDRPLANSPLPDRPRSLSPFSAAELSHRNMHSLDGANVVTDAAAQQPQQQQQQHVDYKEPRALHSQSGARPVRLSAFEDPIWEVVQDMREQRMSLCQSLRQYVFVHAAIIEGALMVVDEERARAGVAWRAPVPMVRRGGMSTRPGRPTLFLMPSDETQSTTSSTGKRLASPTELPKEDKKGEIVLSKRPSIKRKTASADEYTYTSPLATFPPP